MHVRVEAVEFRPGRKPVAPRSKEAAEPEEKQGRAHDENERGRAKRVDQQPQLAGGLDGRDVVGVVHQTLHLRLEQLGALSAVARELLGNLHVDHGAAVLVAARLHDDVLFLREGAVGVPQQHALGHVQHLQKVQVGQSSVAADVVLGDEEAQAVEHAGIDEVLLEVAALPAQADGAGRQLVLEAGVKGSLEHGGDVLLRVVLDLLEVLRGDLRVGADAVDVVAARKGVGDRGAEEQGGRGGEAAEKSKQRQSAGRRKERLKFGAEDTGEPGGSRTANPDFSAGPARRDRAAARRPARIPRGCGRSPGGSSCSGARRRGAQVGQGPLEHAVGPGGDALLHVAALVPLRLEAGLVHGVGPAGPGAVGDAAAVALLVGRQEADGGLLEVHGGEGGGVAVAQLVVLEELLEAVGVQELERALGGDVAEAEVEVAGPEDVVEHLLQRGAGGAVHLAQLAHDEGGGLLAVVEAGGQVAADDADGLTQDVQLEGDDALAAVDAAQPDGLGHADAHGAGVEQGPADPRGDAGALPVEDRAVAVARELVVLQRDAHKLPGGAVLQVLGD
ncbi:uncharacterized protein BcabD6B2_19310 [Babesia caballi]|uniref:Uncharacterized protein n=1 Tax=Babesia caballi TaxID=5871 RepID=A0AAV4LRQ6_BABCB|nr:hypothetical protein BcabD6B2_19310 [Babesia caballi]